MHDESQQTVLGVADLLRRDLIQRYGPVISDDDLRTSLGYKSMDAFRQALARKTVPVPVFSLENRRGKFALAQDIAAWLASKRSEVITSNDRHAEASR